MEKRIVTITEIVNRIVAHSVGGIIMADRFPVQLHELKVGQTWELKTGWDHKIISLKLVGKENDNA